MCSGDVLEFIDQLNLQPPSYVIDAAVYMPKKGSEQAVDEEGFQGLQSFLGAAQPHPPAVLETLKWCESFGISCDINRLN